MLKLDNKFQSFGTATKSCLVDKGLSIKYVTLEGERVREGDTVCDSGVSQEHVTSHLSIFLLYT